MPPIRPSSALFALAALLAAIPVVADSPPAPSRLVVVDRSITLERGNGRVWQVEYRFRNEGSDPLTIEPGEIAAKVGGWVSNSRVPGHATPRQSALSVSGSSGTAVGDVIPSADESQRCRERIVLQAWTGDSDSPPAAPAPSTADKTKEKTAVAVVPGAGPLTVAPGGVARVRLRLEHEHFLYGPYNALLGPRPLELHFGPAVVRDTLPLDREYRVARGGGAAWPVPPADMLDNQVFLSAPDSLHLEAQVAGKQSHRFERAVRYGTKMRLCFWYLIAPASEGEYKVKLTQHKESPTTFRTLPDGEWDRPLTALGRWTRVERVFRTEADATTLTLEFRILGAEWGDLWIDDVTLEPYGEAADGP